MSYSVISSALTGALKATVRDLFTQFRENFIAHQERINTLEQLTLPIPTGAIGWYTTASVPTGFLSCDGSAVSRATYADLFAAIGETWGAGDGSTTFNLPDGRDGILIGAGQGAGLTNRTVGATVGANTHTLSEAELPGHTHGVTDPGHTHDFPDTGTGSSGSSYRDVTSFGHVSSAFQTVSSEVTGASLANTGGGSSHQNMQPYLVFQALIKT